MIKKLLSVILFTMLTLTLCVGLSGRAVEASNHSKIIIKIDEAKTVDSDKKTDKNSPSAGNDQTIKNVEETKSLPLTGEKKSPLASIGIVMVLAILIIVNRRYKMRADFKD
ncbi:LPXTG cell wall anchor domain-containing protein [Candidatus Enterococcus ferrettii]|uniref:Gram-positive cocci surface proteins LPxTG domain-containing protein n=1 Tax=Candidatus Enterococcus ferrettii TaxID=2815324 RepID=A0ABV0ENQ0_9ENTE|nr:LPXTG cell wall anchor domain-containing protein [Enterococcus sp. 665A]MBO1340915.1 LPXTG cell wall anchor domain-containing protein [Enterococcus sp. 665A]